tara:strand:+ start:47 stop:1225 length:1179 start_codon:yes stop_codon:yes gene_type:complete
MQKSNKELLGSRLGNGIKNAVNAIPNNGVTRAIGTGLKFAEANINRNPLTRLYSKTEDYLINKGGDLAEKVGIDPTVAKLGIGLAIPGPAGEANTAKRLLKSKSVVNTAKSPLWKRMSLNRKFIATHGDSWEEAVNFMESGYKYWGEQVVKNKKGYGSNGTLKGIKGGRYWTNPSTGKTFRLKPSVTSKKVDPNDMKGISLKDEASQQASKFKRDRNTLVDPKKVNEIVAEMGGTPDQARAYLKMNKMEKKALTDYIAKLNNRAGEIKFSLGHKVAAEKFTDGGADIATNLKLEPFKTSKTRGAGNAARSNKAELTDDLNTALNASFSLKEDIAKFLDPTVGAFWVGMNNSQKKQMMELTKRGMHMDDALEKVGFGKTILGESVANKLPPRH